MTNDIYVFTIIIVFIIILNERKCSEMARNYIKGHIVNFYVCFLAIYVGINIYFECISYIFPSKLISTGLPLVIYLLTIGQVINFLIKHIKIKNRAYKINNNERSFIVCINVIIVLIIYILGNRGHVLEILAILLGRFLWVDTIYGKSIKDVVKEVRESIKVQHYRIKEIAVIIIVGEVCYYTGMIILEAYYSNKIEIYYIQRILPFIIGGSIVGYGEIRKIRK
ncbi:hypothetical protein [Clostridium sp.]